MMLRVSLAALSAGLLFATSACAASPTPPVSADDETHNATPAMWRLADADSEIWLLGTFHLLPAETDWKYPALMTAFDAAETVYFEADVQSPQAQQEIVGLVTSSGYAKAGETLDTKLTEEQYAKLTEIAGDLGLPVVALNAMRPWLAAVTLSAQMIVAQGFDPAAGVDAVLSTDAAEAGKAISYFETAKEQLGFFSGLNPETEKQLLVVSLEQIEEQEAEFEAMFAAWAQGDAEALDEFINGSMRAFSMELYDVLLKNRNIAWVDEIDTLMQGEGKIFIAVGAAHLVGADSVPALLADKGYEVSRYGVK